MAIPAGPRTRFTFVVDGASFVMQTGYRKHRHPGRPTPALLLHIGALGCSARRHLAPDGANCFFLAALVIAVAAYLTVLLQSSYGLAPDYMGDILSGGSGQLRDRDRGAGGRHPVPAQLGSSWAKTFSAITEPVVLFVVFTVASWPGMFTGFLHHLL